MSRKNHPNHKTADYRSDEYYKKTYGKDAVVIRLGHINIVHLDRPSKAEIQKRTEEIMREELTGEAFFDDCPLCREFQRHPYDIIYCRQD